MKERKPKYIGMAGSPRYEAMIQKAQQIYAPITRTEALKMLMEEGAKKILKGCDFPAENVRNT